MKKVIFALLLLALICAPVFADKCYKVASVAVNFAIDSKTGIKAESVGAYYVFPNKGSFPVEARVGYMFSFDKDPAVSGVYCDVTVEKELVKAGLAADLHMLDGDLKANLGVIAGFETSEYDKSSELLFSGSALARYTFVNMTNVTPFSVQLEGNVSVYDN